MLNTSALFLNGKAEALAELRDGFNSTCDAAKGAFGKSPAAQAFNEFFEAWFSAFDAQAETMGSVADATQQCAAVYDHAERQTIGAIPAMPTPPPPSSGRNIFGQPNPPVA